MRTINKYLSLLLLGALSFTACQDDFDDPAFAEPSSGWLNDTDNYQLMSILDVKTQFWSDDTNYYYENPETGEPYLPATADGKHMLIKGRVISSDAAGNVYKKLVIQDETAAITFSINANSMNNRYRRGQEIVVDITGMTIGKYAGLQQFGAADDNATYGHQTTFMAYEFFEQHVQMNGLPNLAAIDTITVNDFAQLSGGADVIRKWQSQLVRFNNCSFVNGGIATFADYQTTVSQTLTVNGGTIDVRTSGYSNFYSDVLPQGNGDVVALLEYFNSSYQLTLIDREGCMNFGNPTMGPGAQENPYTVDDAISILSGGGSVSNVWTKGYIVGAVAAGVQNVTGNDDIEFADNPDLGNTLVIAASPDCKEWAQCMVIELPQGSSLLEYGNLVEHPDNYQKEITILGNLTKVLGTYGIITNGSSSSFAIEGVEVPDDGIGGNQPTGAYAPDFNTMNGGEATPYYQPSMTSANGWVATNSILLQGGTSDNNPVFTVFGSASTFAVCLNGKSSACGTLTSPVIPDGLKTLTFDYCQPFSDNKCKLTINIKQNGAVVASDVLENNGMTKLTKYTYSHTFDIEGNFQIEIINEGPSGVDSNKDRTAIWNISWGEDTGGGNTPGTPDTPNTPDTPDTPTGDVLTQLFTTGIGLPDGKANVPTNKDGSSFVASNTGISYSIYGSYCNSGYILVNGKDNPGAFISWSLAFPCKALQFVAGPGCSVSADNKVNIYANGTLISEGFAVNVQSGTFTYEIPAEYQAAGTVYKVESNNTKVNNQFASITYVKAE